MIALVYRYFRDLMIFVLNDDDDNGMTRLLYVYDMMRIVYVYYDLMKLLYRAYINTTQIRRGVRIGESRNISSSAGKHLAVATD